MADYDVAIVGCGPAGMTAAIYAARANMKVLLLDKLAPGGQIVNTFEIGNYPGMEKVGGADLAISMFEHTQKLGVAFDYATVEEILDEGEEKILSCKEGQHISCRAVILATGTRPRMLGVPHELDFAGSGISWCAVCDGANYRDRDVLVLGGGNSAVEESLYLAELARRLTVVTLFDLTADPSACDKLRALPNVDVHEFYDIKEFLPGEHFTGLRAVSTKTGEELVVHADGAFEYIGLQPTTEPFGSLGILNDHGYIQADREMKTARPGIFAAGDAIEKGLRQIVTAESDGAIAAESAARYVRALTR